MRRGADGTPLPDGLQPGALYGDDLRLQLTLDSRLQQVAQQALARQVKQWNAKRGAALVMDARNGEILALASSPSYDPNSFWKYNPSLFREWSVQDLYEPGSTFNADRRANGVIDLPTVLQVSSNVGMVEVMGRLKRQAFWQWLHVLGIDEVPDTDLPGAVAGQLKSRSDFTGGAIEPATAAFGQGFSLTPLKLLQLHGMLVNGGRLVSPHITRGLRSGEGLAASEARTGVPLLDPAVTKQVLAWMETVVQKGSGKALQIPGYRLGGKTGTAQKAHNGTYIPGARICSFVAVLPIEDPRYVVLVVVDEPQGANAYGATVAVPVARQIVEALLVLEKVAPSKPVPPTPAAIAPRKG
jgi:cell division protein FtsI (penicillin-binding protein 3)